MRRLSIGAMSAALAGVAVIAAGCGGGSGSPGGAGYGAGSAPPAKHAAALGTARTGLGTVLVDGRGRTLYLFEKDKGAASSCSGACASIWPPVTSAGKSAAGSGLARAKLGSIKRSDGTTELTYAGHPLYTYAGDAKPGDTKGQGLDQFGAEWYVLAPSGQKIDSD